SSVGFFCANPGSFRSAAAAVATMRAEQGDPEEQRPIPFMVVQSNHDCTVNRRAAELIRDSWLARYGAPSTPFATRGCAHEGVACEHRLYGAPARSVVETVFYEGERGAAFTGAGSHYWVGDNPGEFANPNGPSASELFWDFFRRHPFADNPPPVVTLSASVVDGATIAVEGTATDDDGTVTAVRVQLDGTHPQPPRSAEGTATWTVTFPDLPDGLYVPVAEALDDGGATGRARGEALRIGDAPLNADPTLSIDDVAVAGTCLAVTGEAGDEDGKVVAVEVALAERGFKPATYPTDMDGRRYHSRECGLPGGAYATAVRAVDAAGAETLVAGPVRQVPGLEEVTATWQGHMAAGRLKVYLSPCPAVGFGFCDASFPTAFSRFGAAAFPAYHAPGAPLWYLDPANVAGPAG
ncbi:MAG TPA: Ig-like domain-containing protein, partial [Geminicoccaceae bacterium]|nr:Ig-like domain-containing protein [Geminicoccaceae bacterium]